ncbi:SphA family protein [Paraburkholderia sp. D1E]|uniref:SphA family protein n=1 Tax=Paraburkholderia sp. D1E TaxID=3461398 RepID=UPI0040460FC6
MSHGNTLRRWLLSAVGLACGVATMPSHAYEPGYPGWSMPAGATLGMTAAPAPLPGLYSSEMLYVQQSNTTGPGATKQSTSIDVNTFVASLMWSPGWTVLGGRYEALIVQPFTMNAAGAPLNVSHSGVHNTVIAPVQLSWNLGNTGVYVKTGVAVVMPDGTIEGPAGLTSIGNPWWIIQPNLSVSYLRNGWSLTGNVSTEFNTANTYTGYRTGDILHADLSATKALGKWKVGPVMTYVGQISNDTSSAYYHDNIITNRYNLLALGGLVSYDFGPVKLSLWATRDVLGTATGGGTGTDSATITKGYHVFGNVNFKF